MRRRAVQLLGPARREVPRFRRRASLGGGGANTSKSDGAEGVPSGAETAPAPRNLGTEQSADDPVLVAESMVGTDVFGPYGCEDFVDAAHGLTTETGIAHDAALSFYLSLAARGLDHHETPIPRGALVFSPKVPTETTSTSPAATGPLSPGRTGLSPGYGDGHQVQILASANLGSWTMYGWVYPPW